MQQRWKNRVLRHHLPLASVSALCVYALYVTRPYKDPLSRLSFATAYPALALLCLTLIIGPWFLRRGNFSPISTDLRRDTGIWAAILGLIHTAIGQCVHLRGRPWLYYVYPTRPHGPSGLRHDLFGFSNFTGAAATLVLCLLFATSNDASLRKLGARRWKQLQRWNYLCFLLVAAHAVGYQTIEKQHLPFVAVLALCLLVTCVVQTAGFMRHPSRS